MDPRFFIDALDIPTTEQQDASEFMKKTLTTVEEQFERQKDDNLANFIPINFRGYFSIVTRYI